MKTILVVDDNPKIAAALVIRLQGSGYETITASDGFEGLKLAVNRQPDLIISDIWMPVGLGLSMAGRLKELAPDIPVIFMTAGKEKGLEKSAREVGAAGFFEKPFDSEELLAAVAQALGERESAVTATPAHDE